MSRLTPVVMVKGEALDHRSQDMGTSRPPTVVWDHALLGTSTVKYYRSGTIYTASVPIKT